MALHSSLLSATLGCVPSFRIASRLRAPPERVWAHATSMVGINHELAPLLRMTHPPRMTALGDISPPLGTPLFRSIILLFGVLPIDFDDVTLEAVEPGRGFRERSRTLSQRQWRHERSLEPMDGGVRLVDESRSSQRSQVQGRSSRRCCTWSSGTAIGSRWGCSGARWRGFACCDRRPARFDMPSTAATRVRE
jgi:hypothetical protein